MNHPKQASIKKEPEQLSLPLQSSSLVTPLATSNATGKQQELQLAIDDAGDGTPEEQVEDFIAHLSKNAFIDSEVAIQDLEPVVQDAALKITGLKGKELPEAD
ncbi:hypothetical protein OAO01_08110 [Oligoflexia bacterium]|nr:hypothetical protein [Oligoflexia bacterium]